MPIPRPLVFLLLGCLAAVPPAVKSAAPGSKSAKASLSQAEKQGYPVRTDSNVKGSVTVQAVLIPPRVASRIFGGEIAKYYAVIELTVTNKSPDAALIIQGAYIDYTDWALSGSVRPDQICREGLDTDDKSPFQACTRPDQVASEEYRVVRGQLLNMQPWTYRNTTVRLLTLLGSVASGYSFSLKEVGYNKGITAFTGVVVPGLRTFWQDQTIDQMNHISDFGYQTNKVVPKQGSHIIVCFFPIDRFLTKSFRDVYEKNPAVFFSPFEVLLDKRLKAKFVKKLPPELGEMLTKNQDALVQLLPCYLRVRASRTPLTSKTDKNKEQPQSKGLPSTPKAPTAPAETSAPNTSAQKSPSDQLDEALMSKCLCKLKKSLQTVQVLDLISRLSLNNIRIVIDGVMSVETTTLPAKIQSVEFEDEDKPNFWTDASAPKKGTIKGAYLTGGSPKILNADKYIKGIKTVTEGSNDQTLKFTVTLKGAVPNETQLTFVVEKRLADSSGAEKTVVSAPYIYAVHHVSESASRPPASAGKEASTAQ